MCIFKKVLREMVVERIALMQAAWCFREKPRWNCLRKNSLKQLAFKKQSIIKLERLFLNWKLVKHV